MMDQDKVNILLVDDQPAKLLAYEVILKELGENLVKASSGREALEFLLKNDVAIILVDVCMPELDGFELAAMIREHPRFQKTAMIFISAIQVSDIDRLRGYEMGAVDYVPVPVVPEVLRAKIKVFAELYRKTRQRERLNAELEDRVRPDGEMRWCVGTAAATHDRAGRVVRVSGVTVDITERKHAEERQSLLAREVDHRAKNALALAQSIVRLTRGDDVKAYVQSVEGRINALARVHTVLSLSSWQGAEIRRLVDEELAPYSNGNQIALAGPEIQLQPTTAQTLALALHELVTNSAKYGALSTQAGHLSIEWGSETGLLRLAWEETGG